VATEPDNSPDPDTIATYLADPIIKSSAVKEAGGVMKYWNQAKENRPCISKMGLDFCSAPGKWRHFHIYCCSYFIAASSVDAERAFSVGRLEVNHLQHNTSPQTFKAQVAVGSWARTPLYPGLSETIKIVERQIQGESRARAGERDMEDNETDDDGELSDEEARFFAD
jgi:hypothetical protein